jgi:excinuclease ABC subunit A
VRTAPEGVCRAVTSGSPGTATFSNMHNPAAIVVRGARTHNLKNVDVSLPTGRLIVITGVSGSGKSSLAFDTVYAEGQRRYVESLSAYARQFLERMEKPDVDRIDGICPSIAIRQKNSVRNPRSTVGTVTEIHDYMRLLFARVGRTFCRQCGQEVIRETAEVVAGELLRLPEGTRLILGFDLPLLAMSAESAMVSDEAEEERARLEQADQRPTYAKRPRDREEDRLDDISAEESGTSDEPDDADEEPAHSSLPELRPTGKARREKLVSRTRAAAAAAPADPTPAAAPSSPAADGQEQPSRDAIQGMLDALRRKGFGRLLIEGQAVTIDDVDPAALRGKATISVVIDRLRIEGDLRARLTDSIEIAYTEGGGAAWALELPASGASSEVPIVHSFSERFECRRCRIAYEDPQPRLFSFNNPFGACPTCHGFGNIIELDMDLVVPDQAKSINQGAIEPWTKPHYRSHLAELKRTAKSAGIRLDVAWKNLTDEERRLIVEGDGDDYEGVRGFFRWLERKKYKVHVRVFLSRYRGYLTCPDCAGTRLRREARDVRVGDMTIDRVSALTVKEAQRFFAGLQLSEKEAVIADKVLKEIQRRLGFLGDVGLDYLTLDRLSSTLSGGEAQRINLATSLGSALVGTLYVLDEPSIGLHTRDNQRLIDILRQLRDQGNTVLVVEHDADMISVADHVIDMGLGAGEHGGRVVFAGTVEALMVEPRSLTAKYMRGELGIPIPATRRRGPPQRIKLIGASEHNLKGVDVEFPLNTLSVVTGVSGSGKSTLVHDVLYAAMKRAKGDWDRKVGAHQRLEGHEFVSDVVLVDQAPIGRTPRSNPVTYLKAFDPIRELFAGTKDARARGLTASHFSFNVPGGRCEACQGEGEVRVEMQFLADVFVPCEHCDGRRFKPQVLEVAYRGRSITQVLDMTVREALTFFSATPKVLRRLQVLDEIGLGYLRLGQPATTLSGGEAQRIKIAAHLTSHAGERLLYILDEPTTGLHFDDIAKLLAAFRKLLEAGHTLVVIEHNLDVIKVADWIIDLGPEGGDEGGQLVAMGAPEQVAYVAASHTGRYLQEILSSGRMLQTVTR